MSLYVSDFYCDLFVDAPEAVLCLLRCVEPEHGLQECHQFRSGLSERRQTVVKSKHLREQADYYQ